MKDYERLTKRITNGGYEKIILRDLNMLCEKSITDAFKDRLAELEDKIESAKKWIAFPLSSLDDYLYILHLPTLRNEIIKCEIVNAEYTGCGWKFRVIETGLGTRVFTCCYDLKSSRFDIGVDGERVRYACDLVFTTKEAAEAKLAELKGEK